MSKTKSIVLLSSAFFFLHNVCLSKASIEDIPYELLLEIMQNLDAKSAINFGATADKYYQLSHDENSWRALFENDFGPKASPIDNPKDTWRNRYRATSIYAQSKARLLAMSSKKRFSEAHLYVANMQLQSLDLTDATLEDGYFYRANLKNSELGHTESSRTIFTYAQLQDTGFNFAALINSNFFGAAISGTLFSGAQLAFANFSHATGTKPLFNDAQLQHTNFSHAKLVKANFCGAILAHTNFSFASLREASMQRIQFGDDVDLTETDLTGADLSEARLKSTNDYVTLEWLKEKGVYFEEEHPPYVGPQRVTPGIVHEDGSVECLVQ